MEGAGDAVDWQQRGYPYDVKTHSLEGAAKQRAKGRHRVPSQQSQSPPIKRLRANESAP